MSDEALRSTPLADYLWLQGRLIESRKVIGLSQAAAAKRIGICLRTFQSWEGGFTDPTVPQFIRWARALGVPLSIRNKQASYCAIEVIADLPLSHHSKLVVDALIKAGKRHVSAGGIIDLLYGLEPNGGPERADRYVRTLISRLRQTLHPYGYTITNERHLGYRLTALEAA